MCTEVESIVLHLLQDKLHPPPPQILRVGSWAAAWLRSSGPGSLAARC